MANNARLGAVFLVIGISFLAIGASGQRAFTAVGIAFLAIAIVRMVRARRLRP